MPHAHGYEASHDRIYEKYNVVTLAGYEIASYILVCYQLSITMQKMCLVQIVIIYL